MLSTAPRTQPANRPAPVMTATPEMERLAKAFVGDHAARVYGFFACFKDSAGSSCRTRGTARWDGDAFVNDYEENEHGKKTKWRDSFVQMTPTSHTLVAAREAGDGTMQTLITSRSVRR